jgi:hypothetical protein
MHGRIHIWFNETLVEYNSHNFISIISCIILLTGSLKTNQSELLVYIQKFRFNDLFVLR